MPTPPYRDLDVGRNWAVVGTWPCRWIALPHPRGEVRVAVQQEAGQMHGHLTLPPGVTATLCTNGAHRTLTSGDHHL